MHSYKRKHEYRSPSSFSCTLSRSVVHSLEEDTNIPKRAKTGHSAKQPIIQDGPPVSPTLIPAMPEPLPPTTTTSPNQDELAFFDRVKKFIGNKNTMNEFLKLCNLFSQDLIDKQLLLYRANSFLGGNPELFAWFKKFMGDDEEQGAPTRAKIVNSRVSLSNCRSLGPSYRLLPKRVRAPFPFPTFLYCLITSHLQHSIFHPSSDAPSITHPYFQFAT